jgi:hypothetical protein
MPENFSTCACLTYGNFFELMDACEGISLTQARLIDILRSNRSIYCRYPDLVDVLYLNLCGLSDLGAVSSCQKLRVLYAGENCKSLPANSSCTSL